MSGSAIAITTIGCFTMPLRLAGHIVSSGGAQVDTNPRNKCPETPNEETHAVEDLMIAYCSPDALKQIRKLPQCVPIVLFTPIVELSDFKDNKITKRTTQDPFEHFGRAISQHHADVNHVPYSPHVGILPIHRRFLGRGVLVIITTCEPTTNKASTVAAQVQFLDCVCDILDEKDVPWENSLWVVQFGQPTYRPRPNTDCRNVVVASEYTADVAQSVARKMFADC